MAKPFKSNLPKVISKANKDISTIIENDIAKESALLKDLVDQVLKANLEVKKKNNQRITETKRKLAELDEQIESLNVKIDLVDRETVIEQLNEMIDAENKIFNARQEIRFFDNELLPDRITTLNDIYNDLTVSIKDLNTEEEQFRNTLINSNDLLLAKQLEVTNDIINEMDQTFNRKQDHIQNAITELQLIKQNIIQKEQQINDLFFEELNKYYEIIRTSTTTFSQVDSDEELSELLNQEHEDNLTKIDEELNSIKETFEAKKQEIIDNYKSYETSVKDKFNEQNKSVLQKEQAQKEAKEEQIKSIRLDIMAAERSGDIEKVQTLMKEVTKLEKTQVTKQTSKVKKETKDVTKKQYDRTLQHLKNLEVRHTTDLNKIAYKRAYEALRFEEAKILHKIKVDYDGMNEDIKNNRNQITNIKTLITEKDALLKEVYNHKLDIRLSELEISKENAYLELELITTFKTLLNAIKVVEQKRNVILKQTSNNQQIIKVNEEFKLKKAIEDIKLDQETNDIDKLILRKRNETLIKNEKLKEELNSEVIYQESLIKIAQKEHELQMIKVKSLYENERSLAEEQVERINLGVKVNDTFVKTTLQNQLLFATQQINCAQSEYEIRVESINLTHDQEVQYANKKIEYYTQKYEYEKNKYRKELDDKLEDLNYKLLLFTDEKDNKEITQKIEELKAHYEGLIDEINHVEAQDKEIIRYERVITDADNRQEQAINEAEALKSQTVTSFEALYKATKEKYDLIEEENQTEETRGIMPLLNNTAISSADERLKQAIKEADELYNERIENPQKVIKETKEKITELTNSDETEKFIDEQKQLKKELLKKHHDNMQVLETTKETDLKPLLDNQSALNSEFDEIKVEETVFEVDYRTKTDIDSDYEQLILKERNLLKVNLESLDTDKKERILNFDSLLKETTKDIKKVLKPYKKYMRRASRGVTQKKRRLKKEYNKLLKKQVNETEKRIKETPAI